MIKVVAAVMVNEGRVLIAKKSEGKALAGLWEFPGGKVEAGEAPEEALQREIQEEMGVEIEVGSFIAESVHSYGTKTIQLLAYWARYKKGEWNLKDHSEVLWAKPIELKNYELAPADQPFILPIQKTQLDEIF